VGLQRPESGVMTEGYSVALRTRMAREKHWLFLSISFLRASPVYITSRSTIGSSFDPQNFTQLNRV